MNQPLNSTNFDSNIENIELKSPQKSKRRGFHPKRFLKNLQTKLHDLHLSPTQAIVFEYSLHNYSNYHQKYSSAYLLHQKKDANLILHKLTSYHLRL